ncbi:hypothetical protein [Streptomyces reniochalinae]|uniref:Uncharacterized protein n=1 Tax=Streptomyces reniochalinae TaxID=2250578 RepID=A0A367E5E3_9ACTN|nr:hypothetical protein [Streptomyces reniochalinae]RCG13268.1 hypothetical protein DQ392_33750 [Streptomyces reniochalinae]
MNSVLFSIPALLLLASIALVLLPFEAREDPTDPTATVREKCGSLLSPRTLKNAAGRSSITPVCEYARKARWNSTGQLLAWGAGTSALVGALHIRRRRNRSRSAAEPRQTRDR